MKFVYKAFEQLSLNELYDIMHLRQQVFVVEQNCVYLDADGMDAGASHLLGFEQAKRLVAYARIFPAGVVYPDHVAIGRVVSSPSVRGEGVGKRLMRETIERIESQFGSTKIKISAQCYLTKFYETFGFHPVGDVYLEDGIEHIAMIRDEL